MSVMHQPYIYPECGSVALEPQVNSPSFLLFVSP